MVENNGSSWVDYDCCVFGLENWGIVKEKCVVECNLDYLEVFVGKDFVFEEEKQQGCSLVFFSLTNNGFKREMTKNPKMKIFFFFFFLQINV